MLQIYTGEGKGKTTAAIGLAVRAAGADQKVLFLQMIKDGKSSEIGVLRATPGIEVKIFGTGKRIFKEKENKEEKQKIEEGVAYLCAKYLQFDVIIMDEAITAVDLGLLDEKSLICLVKEIAKTKEVILTGHNAQSAIIEEADLVTEMQPVKHYYQKGIKARKGIEY